MTTVSQCRSILLKFINLLDEDFHVYILKKDTRNFELSSRIHVSANGGCAFQVVRPGIDTDQDQTLLACTNLPEAIDRTYDVFEIGESTNGEFFFRSSDFAFTPLWERCVMPKKLHIAAGSVVPISIEHLEVMLVAYMVPPMSLRNTVELIWQNTDDENDDEDDDDEEDDCEDDMSEYDEQTS